MQQVFEQIHACLDESLSLERLAGLVHMSPRHFSRVFKDTTGLSPHQYILRARVKRAEYLLLHTDVPIAEVARIVGFYSQSHLNRHLKRALGLTPRQLRVKGKGTKAAHRKVGGDEKTEWLCAIWFLWLRRLSLRDEEEREPTQRGTAANNTPRAPRNCRPTEAVGQELWSNRSLGAATIGELALAAALLGLIGHDRTVLSTEAIGTLLEEILEALPAFISDVTRDFLAFAEADASLLPPESAGEPTSEADPAGSQQGAKPTEPAIPPSIASELSATIGEPGATAEIALQPLVGNAVLSGDTGTAWAIARTLTEAVLAEPTLFIEYFPGATATLPGRQLLAPMTREVVVAELMLPSAGNADTDRETALRTFSLADTDLTSPAAALDRQDRIAETDLSQPDARRAQPAFARANPWFGRLSPGSTDIFIVRTGSVVLQLEELPRGRFGAPALVANDAAIATLSPDEGSQILRYLGQLAADSPAPTESKTDPLLGRLRLEATDTLFVPRTGMVAFSPAGVRETGLNGASVRDALFAIALDPSLGSNLLERIPAIALPDLIASASGASDSSVAAQAIGELFIQLGIPAREVFAAGSLDITFLEAAGSDATLG